LFVSLATGGKPKLKKERIEDAVVRLGTPVAETLQYELVDVEYRKEGTNWILRCFIDSATGIGIDDCQRFSEALEEILDREDPIPGSFLLEVSSPGIERPLKNKKDYIRFTGNKVEIRLHKAWNNQKRFQGELLGWDETAEKVRVKIEDRIMEVSLEEIAKANLVAEFFGGTERGKGCR
jgi:ribosome maturation factor RimP